VKALVLDASAALAACIPGEADSAAAGRLLDASLSEDGPALVTPDLFLVECASALRKAVLRGRIGGATASDALGALAVAVGDGIPASVLVAQALSLARRENVSLYDAMYVALAERVGAPLVTADRRLARALRGRGFDVRVLGEVWS
jgi:predicted nucleic acid-binding protein